MAFPSKATPSPEMLAAAIAEALKLGVVDDSSDQTHKKIESVLAAALSVGQALLQTYLFDTEVGSGLAVAASVVDARLQLVGLLKEGDQAIPELTEALASTEPMLLGTAPYAAMSWIG